MNMKWNEKLVGLSMLCHCKDLVFNPTLKVRRCCLTFFLTIIEYKWDDTFHGTHCPEVNGSLKEGKCMEHESHDVPCA